MRFVADSNILFTFFWKNSVFNKLSEKQELNLYSPEYALEEISKYAYDIMQKAKITKNEFKNKREELTRIIQFVSLNEYSELLKKMHDLIKNLPQDEYDELTKDIDFLALALKLNCPIWSNDKLLKKQNFINVLSTKEIISLIDNLQ